MVKKINEKKKREVQCSNCSYKWETNSKRNFVTCPNCMRKTQIEELKKGERKC